MSSFTVGEKGGQFNFHPINVQMIFLEGVLPHPTEINVETYTSDEMLQSYNLMSTILDIKPYDAVLNQPAALRLPINKGPISGKTYKVLQWVQGSSEWMKFPAHDNKTEAYMISGGSCFLNIAHLGKYVVVTTDNLFGYDFASENCNNNNGNDSGNEDCENDTNENDQEDLTGVWHAGLIVEKVKDQQVKAMVQITDCEPKVKMQCFYRLSKFMLTN